MTSRPKSNTPNKEPERRRQIIKRVIIAGIVLVAVFGVYELGRQYHYWGEPDTLRALKTEPITNKKLLGLELVRSEQKGQGEIAMIETPAPSVTHEFRAQTDGVEATKQRIINYAESDGWVYDPTVYSQDENNWLWRKQGKESPRMTLVVTTTKSTIVIEVTAYGSYATY